MLKHFSPERRNLVAWQTVIITEFIKHAVDCTCDAATERQRWGSFQSTLTILLNSPRSGNLGLRRMRWRVRPAIPGFLPLGESTIGSSRITVCSGPGWRGTTARRSAMSRRTGASSSSPLPDAGNRTWLPHGHRANPCRPAAHAPRRSPVADPALAPLAEPRCLWDYRRSGARKRRSTEILLPARPLAT